MRTIFRPLALAVMLLAIIGIAVPNVPVLQTAIGVEQAHAQKKKRKSLFDVLFKKRKKKRATRPSADLGSSKKKKQTTKKRRKTKKAKRNQSTRKTAKAKPSVIVVKSDDAAKILVVGDFIGGSVAKGLTQFYSANPNVVVVNKSNAASGIVRVDVVDWSVAVPDLIEEFKPAVVVNLVGMNDRQQMRLSSGRFEKLSEEWLAEYKNRAKNIASSGPVNNVPLLWVGLPPVRSSRMNTDFLAFNEIYRSNIEAAGGVFVDVWDGFTNAEGKYVSAGPDINGQIVRLRGSKGIGMTRAGSAKLAFYVDRALRKIGLVFGQDGSQVASLGGGFNSAFTQPTIAEYDPATSGKTVVIALGSPASDGGIALEGEKDFLTAKDNTKSVSFDLVENGLGYLPKFGRVDSDWGQPALIKVLPEFLGTPIVETISGTEVISVKLPELPEIPVSDTTVSLEN